MMLKKILAAYLLGVLSVLGFAYHMGSDAIVQCGLKLAAMETRYVYDAQPQMVVDETQVAMELARPIATKRRK